jgi:hypothetical protein
MTSIRNLAEEESTNYYAFRVYRGEAREPCFTIGAFGKSYFSALKNAIDLFRPSLNKFGDPNTLDYSVWRKDND